MAQPDAPTKNTRGASAASVSWQALFHAWRTHHAASATDSLYALLKSPLQNLMTVLVIGITLALPTLFNIALDNFQALGMQWDGAPRISLFLKKNSGAEEIASVRNAISTTTGIVSLVLVTPEEGLAEFEKQANIEGTLELLDKNPLPPVLVATFDSEQDTHQLDNIRLQWQTLANVDQVIADLAWIKKLNLLLDLGQRIVIGLASMLGLGALLSIGNTIRLAIENRRTEIVVATLVGATHAFVRRPFLYTGFWYGLSGGLVAITLVLIGYHALIAPVTTLALLYESEFQLQGLTFNLAVGLLFIGVALGIVGAWLAVTQHLHSTRPQ